MAEAPSWQLNCGGCPVSSQNSWVLQNIRSRYTYRWYVLCHMYMCKFVNAYIRVYLYVYVSDVRICIHLEVYIRDENTWAFWRIIESLIHLCFFRAKKLLLHSYLQAVQLALLTIEQSKTKCCYMPIMNCESTQYILDTVIRIYGLVPFWQSYWLSSQSHMPYATCVFDAAAAVECFFHGWPASQSLDSRELPEQSAPFRQPQWPRVMRHI